MLATTCARAVAPADEWQKQLERLSADTLQFSHSNITINQPLLPSISPDLTMRSSDILKDEKFEQQNLGRLDSWCSRQHAARGKNKAIRWETLPGSKAVPSTPHRLRCKGLLTHRLLLRILMDLLDGLGPLDCPPLHPVVVTKINGVLQQPCSVNTKDLIASLEAADLQ